MITKEKLNDLFGEAPYRMLVEEIRDFAIFHLDTDGRIVSWNEGARHIFGYEEREVLGQPFSLLFTPEDTESGVPERELQKAATEGCADDVRWHLRKDGTRFYANGVTTALRGESGALLGFAKVARDDTQRKQTEDKQRESEAFSRSILESSADCIKVLDLDGNLVSMNAPGMCLMEIDDFGNFEGRCWIDFWQGEEHEMARAAVETARQGGTGHFRGYANTAKGRRKYWDVIVSPILDAEGNPKQILSVSRDITELSQAEEVLRKSEERYRTLFNSIDEGFCIIEMLFDENDKPVDYRFLETNPTFEKQTGLVDVQGKRMRELAPTHEEHWFENYGKVALTGEPTRFENRAEALNRWFDVYAFRVEQAERREVAVLFKDITERKRSEEEREQLLRSLEVERSRLADIFAKSPAFVATSRGPKHIFEITNPAFRQLVGHRDLIGKTAREAFPDIEGQGFYELLDKVFQTGEPFEGREIPVSLQRTSDGALEEIFVDLLYQPLFETDGSVSGILTHGVDITEQVKARKQAEETNRIKDEFLATLSHELRTPLTSVLGWASMLRSGKLNAEASARALEIIERNARAQNQLIDDLLDVSRIITGKLRLDVQPVELSTVIEAAADAVRPAANAKGIRLQVLLDSGVGAVSGDADRLQQVVWNLLTNAVKFTPKGGRVQARLERVNSHVEITVSDTGKGIEPEFLPHVFDRFRQADQTSTRAHGGLGLGLSIVRQIVELHGGTVHVESEGEGQGTNFIVKLPYLATVSRRATDREERVHPTAGGSISFDCAPELTGLRVLVVDDEPDTRALVRAVLEQCGSEVMTAGSAAEALAVLEELKPDLLVSDIGMPEEDGYQLIGKVRALAAEQGGRIPAIALTAYARIEDRVRALTAGFQVHVPKPIEPVELAAVVASLVGRTGRSRDA